MILLFLRASCALSFIYEGFFALPSFSFSHPTVNMEIVFVSLFVYTHPCMHIYTYTLCRDPLMSVFYTVLNADLCCAPAWMQWA